MVEIDDYDAARDRDAVARIWHEVGWTDGDEREARGLATFFDGGRSRVARVNGDAECAVHRSRGRVRYADDDLDVCLISAVTVGRVARRLGLASKMTASALVEGAAEGAHVGYLGMFEEGFYDRLGFGTGCYEHRLTFDPSSLDVAVSDRTPVRLGPEHASEVHDLLVRRARSHGGLVTLESETIAAEFDWFESPIGLGYRDGAGKLTHAVLGEAKGETEADLTWMLAEEPEGIVELLGLVRSQSDQWVQVRMYEPPEVQLQDLIDAPIRQRRTRTLAGGGVPYESIAWWQARILDLGACIGRCRVAGDPVSFVLDLHDPLDDRDDLDAEPPGLSGQWTVRLGAESSAVRGVDDDNLPVLRSGVGPFSRWWLGVRTASVLARTTDLDAPAALLDALDRALCLPAPHPGIEF